MSEENFFVIWGADIVASGGTEKEALANAIEEMSMSDLQESTADGELILAEYKRRLKSEIILK